MRWWWMEMLGWVVGFLVVAGPAWVVLAVRGGGVATKRNPAGRRSAA